jgi:phosphate transport system substrate-binding protein
MMPVLSNHMHTTLKSLALVALTATAVTVQAADTVTVDPKIPAYAVTSGVSGNLNSVGSDTLNNLMTFWSEGFKAQYPNVKIQVEGKGSGTAPVALASGVAQVGPMSREMKSTEIAAFAAKFGHKPTRRHRRPRRLRPQGQRHQGSLPQAGRRHLRLHPQARRPGRRHLG